MGKGRIYRCPVCGFEKEYETGIGFLAWYQAQTERENILQGFYGPKAQAALVGHPEAPVDVEWALYQCRDCGKLESRLAVKIAAPLGVPIYQRCDCGAIMHRIRAGKEMFCPVCRELLKATDIVSVTLWD